MKNKKLLSILLALVLALSLAMPLAPSARAEGPYKVSLDDSFHGSVTADKDMADEGETVRLTVTPSDGYIIESISVYAIDLYTTVPTTYSEGNYVFTMPASEVQISATFKAAPAPADTEIPSVALSLTLPAAGGSYSGAVPAAVSISSGTGFTVKSANWFNGGTLETNPGCGLAPTSFEPGKPYYAEIFLAPAEGYAFADGTAVTIDTLGVKSKAVIDDEADRMGWLYIVTEDYTIPAATGYIFKGVSFELTGLNQLTSGSDAGKWMPTTPIDWTKILVSIDPGADSAIPDSTLVEAHFDFLYTDAACTTILTGDMQDTGTYYLRLVVNNKNAEDHSIDYSSLAAEHCSATVAGYTTNFVSAAATTFAGKDAVGVVFSVTRNSTPAAPYTITVNGGKAYNGPGAIHSEITSAEAGDKVYVRFDDSMSVPAGKYHAGFTSEQAGQGRYLDLTGDDIVLHFTMPAENVIIDPLFEDQMTLTVDLSSGSATFPYGVFRLLDLSFYAAKTEGKVSTNGEYVPALDSMVTVVDADKDGNYDIINDIENGFSLHDDCNLSGDYVLSGIGGGAPYTGITLKFPASPATTYTVTLIAYDKTNGTEQAGGEVAFSDSGKGTRISGDYEGNSSRTVGVYPASDYSFAGWAKGSPSGEIVSTSSPYTFTVTENVTLYALFDEVTTYLVWVGGTQVTSANKDDILGDGKAKYDPDSKTLTLDNPTISGPTTQTGVIYAEIDELTITGKATLNLGNAVPNGIEVAGNLIISGAGTDITATGGGNGILAKNITISGGTVNATGRNFGVHADSVFGGNVITISGGSVTAKATGSDSVRYGINGNTVSITGGTVTATSTQYAIGGTDISISGGTVTATGDRYGISQSHKFSITGGTLEATGIEVRAFDFSSITVGEGLDVLVNTEASASGATAWNGTDPLGGQNTVIFKYVKIEPGAEKYPVWVGGVQVTSANKDDILGDGKASFDPDSNTLTLNGLTLNGAYSEAAILVKGIDLTIVGSANVTNTSEAGISSPDPSSGGGITLNGDFTITGTTAIGSYPGVTVSGGTLKATATGTTSQAFSTYSPITISDGLEIIKPEGGKLSSDQRTIEDAAGNPATYVEIGPKSVTYPVWVGGEQVTSVNKDDILGDGTASFDPDSNTLTFTTAAPAITGLHNNSMIYADGIDLTINTASGGLTLNSEDATYGIHVNNGDLNSKASLNITVKNSTWFAVYISNGNLDVTGDLKTSGYVNVNGNVTVSGNATVDSDFQSGIIAKKINIGNDAEIKGKTYGINASDDVTVGGNLKATATQHNSWFAVYVSSGNLDVTGDLETSGYVNVNGNVTVSGNVTVDSGFQIGIIAKRVAVVSGRWDVTGTVYAIRTAEGIDIPATHGITTPTGGKIAQVTVDGNTFYTVTESDGSTVATHAIIEPKAVTYPVWVGGTQVTSANKDDILGDGGKAKFDPASNTLTLNGVTVSTSYNGALIYAEGIDLNITGKATLKNDNTTYGVLVKDGSLDSDANLTVQVRQYGVSATKSININGGSMNAKTTGHGSDGVGYALGGSDIKISSGTVTAETAQGPAISAANTVEIGGGTVNVTGGYQGVSTKSLTISGGTVTVEGDWNGIIAEESVTISGGSVTATGGRNGIRSDLYDGQILISGGTVKATGTSEIGISGACPIDITGGTVEAKGGTAGIQTSRNITIGNGITKVTADGASNAIRGHSIGLGDALIIQEPAGGTIGYLGGGDTVLDGTTVAAHAVIEPKAEKYPVWVGGVQVTSANKDDILGDGGKAKFDPDTNTLTLNNPTISGYYLSAAIWINVSNATVTGALDLTVPSSVYNGAGISYQYSSGTLTLNGDFTINAPNMGIHSAGSVSITGGTYNLQGASAGIYAQTGNISISGGAVTARATGMGVSINGIRANNGSVVISGGTVTATGRTCGIYSDNDTIISGGEVTAKATGTDSYGINVGGNLKIENGITKVTADGTTAIVSTGGVITLGDALIIEEPAGGKLSSDGKAIKNADDTEAAHAVIVPKGVTYPVWVGGVQVTSANKDDILGDGTASFDPDTNTLTLNGLNVGDGYHASGASIVSTGIDLTVKGSATLSGGGYGIYVIETTEGGGNLTLDGADITYTVPSGSDTGIRADGNISISGGTIDVTAAKNGIRAGSSVTISGGSVTATGSECGISVAHGDVTISGGTVNAKSDTVGIEATNGTIKIQNGTTSVTADGAGAAIGAGGITIGDEMMIKEPAGGFIGDITGSRVIKNPDDTTATHTVIVPKEAEKFPVEVVITTHDKDGNVISTVGGTATADKTEVAKGDTITVTVTPNPGFELESIEFSDGVTGGYQAGKETSSTVPNDFTTSTGKLQIDVLFKETAPATTHTVTFEANGGTPVPAAQTVADGEKAVKPADPTRSGFVFDGWYADATFAAAFDFGAAITADVTVYAKWKEEAAPGEIVYTIVSGGNSTWTKGSSSGVTIVVKRDPNDEECFSHFTSVQIGSTTLVSGTDYTAVAGSTVITLNASTLQKLTTGTKTVTINFDDGKAATDLTIKAGSSGTSGGTSPKTGDNSNPGLWLAVMVLSGLGIGGLVVNDKKRRYVGRH